RRATTQGKPAADAGDKSAAASAPQPPARPVVPRANAPVIIVDGPRPGQSGYVHFFLLDLPDGDTEIQVAIELPDQRIAWSFPELGVGVTPFIRSGPVEVNGRTYGVKHLYGVRPFPDDESMLALDKAIWDRVVLWVEDATPYCNSVLRPEE